MPLEPNRAPEQGVIQGKGHDQPGAFLNNAIVALVGLPLYFTSDWKVCPWARWPLFFVTVMVVLLCGVNPLREAVNRVARHLYDRKSRPGKPAVLSDEMNFDRTPATSGWSDQEFMAAYEGDVLSMGYRERYAEDPAPYTAFRLRKRKNGRIECLIAVEGWDYPEFHRVSLPPPLAALLYNTRHTD
jgi:hypothetical protein